jgi:hypothetical protein
MRSTAVNPALNRADCNMERSINPTRTARA